MRLPGADSATAAPPLDLLSDFIQRSQDQLEAMTPIFDTPEPQQVEQAEAERDEEQSRREQERTQLSQRLQATLRDVRVQQDPALKSIVERLLVSIDSPAPRSEAEQKLLKQLVAPGQLLQHADGFGQERVSLPASVKEAIAFLQKYEVQAPRPTDGALARGDLETSDRDEAAALALAELNDVHAGDEAHDGALPEGGRDPRIRDFIQKYFANTFEHAPPPRLQDGTQPATPLSTPQLQKDAQLKDAQPKELRADVPAFEKLSPEEQTFLLTADDRHANVYLKLPQAEKSVFRELKPQERGEFLKLSADEKQFVKQLQPDERSFYLSLNPDSRAELRNKSPEERARIFAENRQQQAQAKKEPPEKLAPRLGSELLRSLGIKAEKKPQLLEKARALAFNFLHQSKGDLLQAQAGTLKALLALPEVQRSLEKEVGQAISQLASGGEQAQPSSVDAKETSGAGARTESGKAETREARDFDRGAAASRRGRGGLPQSTPDYVATFQRVKQALPDFALRLAQPGLTREHLVEGMKKAVVLSAEFAHAHPPRRKGNARSEQIKKGFAGRTHFG